MMVEPKTENLGEKQEIWSENQKTQSTRVTPPRETFKVDQTRKGRPRASNGT